MNITFTNLPDMRSAYLVGMSCIVLNFIMFQHRILLYHYLHDTIGKTFTGTEGRKRFYYLGICILREVNKTTWLREDIGRPGICNIIQVDGMLKCLPFIHINKNTS